MAEETSGKPCRHMGLCHGAHTGGSAGRAVGLSGFPGSLCPPHPEKHTPGLGQSYGWVRPLALWLPRAKRPPEAQEVGAARAAPVL